MGRHINPTDVEVFFDKDDIIVSKTDPKGRITYANKTFCDVAGYTEAELLGQQHNIIRHPDMPRAVFKLMWDVILDGREIFAYVKNLAKSGAYYWVFAHVTPSFDRHGRIIAFHSSRRVPDRRILETTIIPLYAAVLQEEKRHHNGKAELAAGFAMLTDQLRSKKMTYDEFIFSL